MRPENRAKHWLQFLKDNHFDEVIKVATVMREKGKITEEEIASLLEPEDHCPMQSKVDYIVNVMLSLRIADNELNWRGD